MHERKVFSRKATPIGPCAPDQKKKNPPARGGPHSLPLLAPSSAPPDPRRPLSYLELDITITKISIPPNITAPELWGRPKQPIPSSSAGHLRRNLWQKNVAGRSEAHSKGRIAPDKSRPHHKAMCPTHHGQYCTRGSFAHRSAWSHHLLGNGELGLGVSQLIRVGSGAAASSLADGRNDLVLSAIHTN